jgi:hypothetical protein
MYVSSECCVMSGRRVFDGPITHPEESYRLCCHCVSSTDLKNEAALARVGLLRQETGKESVQTGSRNKPASYVVSTAAGVDSFTWVKGRKRPGREASHPPQLARRLRMRGAVTS